MTRSFSHLGPALSGAVLMILAGALFAVVNTLVQYGAMVQGLPSARLAFWQYLIASVAALPWAMRRGRAALAGANLPLHLLRVLLAAGGVQLWVAGLAHVPIWQAIALIMLSPFFVTLGAGLLLGEQTGRDRWLAVVAGFAGGMIVLAPWSEAFSLYALLPVAASALWAGTSLLTKRLTRREGPEAVTLFLLVLLTPLNALVALPEGLGLSGGLPGALLLTAGVLTALAQYLLARAYSVADAAYLQPFDHVKLPFNVLLGLAVFGFVPPGALWLGSALIVGASFLLLRREALSPTWIRD
ncbi:MAG: DMT family transporter [Rhodobacter sp.]|uniref:DMT family transporter n=1 Tax=Pararhodobacter sp. TaxID=2127056 RepID=UPI001DB1B4CE|nr:DMT family transporter [Pararhodobacter sp.]MCB1345876.1 DMT family transporter [Paracoccaceae bacterium]MCC0073914.1 DMT family transporter [Rhodobacter sp.]HPD92968.1 DMT family transporter [Pararhodobacter sp.]